ncbi:MAG: hypothetical protein P8Y36_06030 [Alphaproteobacteria bacterium]
MTSANTARQPLNAAFTCRLTSGDADACLPVAGKAVPEAERAGFPPLRSSSEPPTVPRPATTERSHAVAAAPNARRGRVQSPRNMTITDNMPYCCQLLTA